MRNKSASGDSTWECDNDCGTLRVTPKHYWADIPEGWCQLRMNCPGDHEIAEYHLCSQQCIEAVALRNFLERAVPG